MASDPLAQAQHAAGWALRFAPVNQEQAEAHQADIDRYATMLQQQAQAQHEQRMQTDSHYLNYYRTQQTMAQQAELQPYKVKSEIARMQRDHSQAVLAESKQRLADDLETDRTNRHLAVVKNIDEARKQFGAGTPQFTNAAFNAASALPNLIEQREAFGNAVKDTTFDEVHARRLAAARAKEQPSVEDIAARRVAVKTALGEASTGLNADQLQVADELKNTYGMTPAAFKPGLAVMKAGNVDPVSGDFTQADPKTASVMQIASTVDPTKKKLMPMDDFNRIHDTLYPPAGSAPAAQPGATPAGAPTPIDRISLAKEALNDPSASAEHKAAAQKILSSQTLPDGL